MKKRLFLAVLPALLVLSGCKSLSADRAVNANAFKESATAESEIFGNRDVLGGNLQVKRRDPGEAITTPKMGYQIHYDSENEKLAIRFIAAINDLNVKAYWKRGVASWDGTTLANKEFSDDPIQVTKYYKSLTDGTNTITAGEAGDYEDYQGFVVYTIYGIPYDNYDASKAYVAAYLTLEGDENEGGAYDVHSNSQALAVSVEMKSAIALKNVFAFDPTVTGYFLEGKINGDTRDGSDNTTHSLVRGEDYYLNYVGAVYNDITFKTTDSFGSFYYSPSSFKFFGHNYFFGDAADYFDEASLSEFNKPKANGTKTLYVFNSLANSAAYDTHVKKEINLYFTHNYSWGSQKAYLYNDTAETGKTDWPGENMSIVSVNDYNDFVYECTVDLGLFDRVIFNGGDDEHKADPIELDDAENLDAYCVEGSTATKWGSYSGPTTKSVIYFINSFRWSGDIHYYIYKDSPLTEEEGWPGKAAKWTANNEYSQGIYRIAVDLSPYEYIIFNNNSGSQSLSIPVSAFTGANNAVYLDGDTYVPLTYNDPLLP